MTQQEQQSIKSLFSHCSYIIFPWVSSVRCYLSLQPGPSSGTFSVYLAVQPAELSPVGNKRSPDTRWSWCFVYSSSSMSTSLWFYPHSTLFKAFWGWKNTPAAQTLDVMSLLSPLVYRLTFPCPEFLFLSCPLAGISLVVPAVPPFCDVIFVKQVFQSQEKESENGRVCFNAWFPLIPWLDCPFLCGQHIVVLAQILHRKVTFVWLAGSPPQRANPAELVHSATTSWPGGIAH